MTEDAHRSMRDTLGAYVLGHLEETESARVAAHLDGCAECRAEHDALAPLAEALRDVDPDALEELPKPRALLGARIESKISAERTRRLRRTAVQRALIGAAASFVLILAFVAGPPTPRRSSTKDAITPPESSSASKASRSTAT